MSRVMVPIAVLLAGIGFFAMVKIMYDMSGNLARMTDEVAAMTADVHAMRESMDRMSTVVGQGAQQMQQVNPMQMMQGVVPGGGAPGR